MVKISRSYSEVERSTKTRCQSGFSLRPGGSTQADVTPRTQLTHFSPFIPSFGKTACVVLEDAAVNVLETHHVTGSHSSFI